MNAKAIRGAMAAAMLALVSFGTSPETNTTSCDIHQTPRWSVEKSKAWGEANPWWCGVNYIPANAVNYTKQRKQGEKR